VKLADRAESMARERLTVKSWQMSSDLERLSCLIDEVDLTFYQIWFDLEMRRSGEGGMRAELIVTFDSTCFCVRNQM
jgi:hypothetical protein